MKALSVQNPYATQILRGTKTIEYRTWKTDYRGDFLICSSANPKPAGMLSGYALCVCCLSDIIRDRYSGEYEWHLTNIRPIEPFPVKGRLHFYEVDDALIHFAPSSETTPKRAQQSRTKKPPRPIGIDWLK